jgi:hypothetical protein
MTYSGPVHFRQPVITAPRLTIAALVMLLFTGLAIWQTAHCADQSPAHGSSVASSTDAADHPAGQHRHDQQARQSHTSVVEDCHIRTTSSVASTVTTVAVATPMRASGRLTPDCFPAPPPQRPASAGISLTAIGISRT